MGARTVGTQKVATSESISAALSLVEQLDALLQDGRKKRVDVGTQTIRFIDLRTASVSVEAQTETVMMDLDEDTEPKQRKPIEAATGKMEEADEEQAIYQVRTPRDLHMAHQLLRARARIAGEKTVVLFDNGATDNFMDSRMVERLGIRTERSGTGECKVLLADGSRVSCEGRITYH